MLSPDETTIHLSRGDYLCREVLTALRERGWSCLPSNRVIICSNGKTMIRMKVGDEVRTLADAVRIVSAAEKAA